MNKTFCVSDVHGMLPLWQQIKDFLQPDDQLIVLGDCADRGRDGWQIIKDCLTDERITYIRGNHEAMLLKAWRAEFTGEEVYLWMCNGGNSTYEAIIMEENPNMWLNELNRHTKYYTTYKNRAGNILHLSHAGFTPMESVFYPSNYDLIWDRVHLEDYPCSWWDKENPNDIVIHGHTPIMTGTFLRNIKLMENVKLNNSKTVCWYCNNHKINIDGGCFATGRIALIDLDTFEEIVFEIPINSV